jgi:hypothetical protein
MADKGVTIAIRDQPGAKARKLTKVISYGADGFGVLMPYHRAHSGLVAKQPVDRSRIGDTHTPWSEMVLFTSEHSVKLSYHADGFAQFSGEVQGKVISGRDPVTKEPKGVGLMTNPLSDPIRTGASVGITAWGLEDFDELDEPAESALVFEDEDAYFRRCTPKTADSTWRLEVHVFPLEYWGTIRKSRSGYSMQMSFLGLETSFAILELKVIELFDVGVVLAGYASRFPRPPQRSTVRSGWFLNGPGQVDLTGKGHVLLGLYPVPPSVETSGLPSIDRPPIVPPDS